MTKRKKNLDCTTGKGWVGRWRDGSVGWVMPEHLKGYSYGSADAPHTRRYIEADDKFYLCKITVHVLKDKKGRPITRSARTLRCQRD